MISNISKLYHHNASNRVKDAAIEVCVASGIDGDDVFIDMDTVEDRLTDTDDVYMDVRPELLEIIELAKEADAQFIHLY